MLMETVGILANLILLGTLLRARLSGELLWLTLIAGLGLGETPLLHYAYAHMATAGYFRLCYGIELANVALYLACAYQLGRTRLHLISFSIWVFIGIEVGMWFSMAMHLETARYALAWVLRGINPITLLFWAWLIFRYDQAERGQTHHG